MHLALFRSSLILIALATVSTSQTKTKWEQAYVWDEADSTLTLTGLRFFTAHRGVAAGFVKKIDKNAVFGERESTRPVLLLTVDGGKTWASQPLKEVPNSFFFLDDSRGWMATESGVWRTEEGGRDWRRIAKLKGINDLVFLDEQHGFVVGEESAALETIDGGVNWKPITQSEKLKLDPDDVVFTTVAFSGDQRGFIAGFAGKSHSTATFLVSTNGGKTWAPSTNRVAGTLTRASFSADGPGLALLEFEGRTMYPSEVFRIDLATGESKAVFRRRDRHISDILTLPDGSGVVAGVKAVGKEFPSPIPGSVRILMSDDLFGWQEVPVDYRAEARRVFLANAGDGKLWAATDTGTILRLVR